MIIRMTFSMALLHTYLLIINYRGGAGPNPDRAFNKGFVRVGAEDMANDALYQPDEMASQGSEGD